MCIAIGRQYICSRHKAKEQLAEKLGYKFYNNEIIKLVANTTNYSENYISKKEEKIPIKSIFDLVNYMNEHYDKHENPKDAIYETELKTIKDISKNGNCVVIRKYADYI